MCIYIYICICSDVTRSRSVKVPFVLGIFYPPSEIDWGTRLAVCVVSEGNIYIYIYICFHRSG